MSEPRKELAKVDDALIEKAIEPLAWSLIKARCEHKDHCATGGISPDTTLILSLVLALVQAGTDTRAPLSRDEIAEIIWSMTGGNDVDLSGKIADTILARLTSFDQHPDDAAVDRFAQAMKDKLKHAREVKGRSGWETNFCSDPHLAEELILHICKSNTGTYEDVANFCMMLHQRGASPHELARAYHQAQAYDPNPDPVRHAAQEILDQVFSTYKARNGREVGVEDDNGEKVWLLPDDAYQILRSMAGAE